MSMRFKDRREAGLLLARELEFLRGVGDVLVLGLPRGGVPVAYEVAKALHAPLDIFIVRKLGVPGQEELALGALASGDVRVFNDEVVNGLGITAEQIAAVTERERRELERRERAYRGSRPSLDLRHKTVVLIDDGLATGSSMRAASSAVSQQSPANVIIAVPVAAAQTCEILESEADRVVCLYTPEPFYAVGLWYEDFSQTSDEEVSDLLEESLEWSHVNSEM